MEKMRSKFLDHDVAPTHAAGFPSVNLQGEKSLGGELLALVFVVNTHFAIEPDLDVVALAADADLVPVVSAENFLSLIGEGLLRCFLLRCVFGMDGRWGEPSAAGLIIDAGRPGTGFAVVVLALISMHTPVFAGFLQSAEHHAGIAAEIVELHVKAEIEVFVGFVGAQEGVRFHVDAGADDGIALDGEFSITIDDGPSGEIFAVEQGGEAFFGIRGEAGKAGDGEISQEFHKGRGELGWIAVKRQGELRVDMVLDFIVPQMRG